MKYRFKFNSCIILLMVVSVISCKKEKTCSNCENIPPIANAGPDQTILLPIDSVTLDGNGSSDPDGTISSLQWTKISGPFPYIINDKTAVRTMLKNLSAGASQFELKVTDNGGLSAKDTVKITVNDPGQPNRPPVGNAQKQAPDHYNLDVELYGQGNENGDIKFRQDPDLAKIVTLDTKIQHLLPNHEYLLQRAVDVIIDGNCTGTAWLTLGFGSTPQSIMTNGGGNGHEELWRDLSAVPSGKVFDIHFRVLDAANMAVVLTSDCYQFTVR